MPRASQAGFLSAVTQSQGQGSKPKAGHRSLGQAESGSHCVRRRDGDGVEEGAWGTGGAGAGRGETPERKEAVGGSAGLVNGAEQCRAGRVQPGGPLLGSREVLLGSLGAGGTLGNAHGLGHGPECPLSVERLPSASEGLLVVPSTVSCLHFPYPRHDPSRFVSSCKSLGTSGEASITVFRQAWLCSVSPS